MLSGDFFGTEEHPTATYRSTSVTPGSGSTWTVQGDLTIKGVTKPVTLKVDSFNCGANPFTKKDMCGADLSGSIKRSDFGMKFGIPAIADEIKLAIAVEGYK